MSITVVTVVLPEYIRFDLTGTYSLEKLFEFLEQAKLNADASTRTHLLINAFHLDGFMTETERFMAGRQIAEVFGSRLKTACVMRADRITKLGELAAVNRGARFLVVGSEDEALNWLLPS